MQQKTNNYTKVYDWMLELELNSTELWIYARIHSLSADGEQLVTTSNSWLSQKLNLSNRQIERSIKSLSDKELIKTKLVKHSKGTSRKILITGYEKNDFEDFGDSFTNVQPKEKITKKETYGEFGNVKLTPEEYAKVKDDYKSLTDKAIEILDDYIESTGKKYKSHRATLKTNGWVWKRLKEDYSNNKQKLIGSKNSSGSKLPTATLEE